MCSAVFRRRLQLANVNVLSQLRLGEVRRIWLSSVQSMGERPILVQLGVATHLTSLVKQLLLALSQRLIGPIATLVGAGAKLGTRIEIRAASHGACIDSIGRQEI